MWKKQKIESYKEAVDKLYSEPFPFDDPDYVYSLRNPVGFYQRMMILKSLVDIFNRNNIRLDSLNFILDLGCGIGNWLRIISEMRGSAKGLVGIDLSEVRLGQARKINKSIKWIKTDMCNLPFKNGVFDLVMTFVSFMFLINEVGWTPLLRQ